MNIITVITLTQFIELSGMSKRFEMLTNQNKIRSGIPSLIWWISCWQSGAVFCDGFAALVRSHDDSVDDILDDTECSMNH